MDATVILTAEQIMQLIDFYNRLTWYPNWLRVCQQLTRARSRALIATSGKTTVSKSDLTNHLDRVVNLAANWSSRSTSGKDNVDRIKEKCAELANLYIELHIIEATEPP